RRRCPCHDGAGPRPEWGAPGGARLDPRTGRRPVTSAPALASTTARRLEGAPFASEIRDRVTTEVATYVAGHGHPPGLAVAAGGPRAGTATPSHRATPACSASATRALSRRRPTPHWRWSIALASSCGAPTRW